MSKKFGLGKGLNALIPEDTVILEPKKGKDKNDDKGWKSIVSVCEKGRTIMDTTKRKTWDVSKIVMDSKIIKFDTKINKTYIKKVKENGEKHRFLKECRECCFGVEVNNQEIISKGQFEYKWLSFKEAVSALKKEEDKKALYELNKRLNDNSYDK